MAKFQFINGGSLSMNDNTTTFYPIIGAVFGAGSEASVEHANRNNGIFRYLTTSVLTNTTLVNTTVFLRNSRVSTSITVTYTSGQTGIKSDTTNIASFVNTDEVDYRFSVANDVSGVTTIVFTSVACVFEPYEKLKTNQIISVIGSGNFSTISTTFYGPPQGLWSTASNTEITTYHTSKFSYTLSNLFTNVSSNARTTDTNIRVRKNSADGSQVNTYTSGQTGAKEDTSNTDSFVSGDNFCYSLVLGASSENIAPIIVSTNSVNTTREFFMGKSSYTTLVTAFNVTRYLPIGGRLFDVSTTEADYQTLVGASFIIKNLQSYASANTITTSATTIRVRKNSANSTLVLSYAAGATGAKEDTTNSDFLLGGTDLVVFQIATPNTSGTFTITKLFLGGQTALLNSPGGGVAYSGAASFQF